MGNVGVSINIYIDGHVRDHHGDKPGKVLKSLVEDALDFVGVEHSVALSSKIPFDVRNIEEFEEEYDCHVGGKTGTRRISRDFGCWLRGNQDIAESADAHHLMFDSSDVDGARGLGGSGKSVAPGDYLRRADPESPDRYYDRGSDIGGQVLTNMQELGHALGLCPCGKGYHNCGNVYINNMVSWEVEDEQGIYYTPIFPEYEPSQPQSGVRPFNSAGHPTAIGSDKGISTSRGIVIDITKENISEWPSYVDAYFWREERSGEWLRQEYGEETAPNYRAPEATFSTSSDEVHVGSTATFDAGDSVDPDGTIDRYDWKVEYYSPDEEKDDPGAGEIVDSGSGETFTATLSRVGSYCVQLTVTCDEGCIDASEETVQVKEANLSNQVVIEGSDPDPTYYAVDVSGKIEQIDGELGDFEVTAEESDQVHEGRALGRVENDNDGYRFSGELQNKEDLAQLSGVTVYVNGEAIGTDLRADFTIEPSEEVVKRSSVRFDASASSAPEGSSIETYSWTITEKQSGNRLESGSGKTYETSVEDVGNYDVTLEVVDSRNRRDDLTKELTITPFSDEPDPVRPPSDSMGEESRVESASHYCPAIYITLDGRTPTRVDYDSKAVAPPGEEEAETNVDIEDPNGLRILAYSVEGSGSYVVGVEQEGDVRFEKSGRFRVRGDSEVYDPYGIEEGDSRIYIEGEMDARILKVQPSKVEKNNPGTIQIVFNREVNNPNISISDGDEIEGRIINDMPNRVVRYSISNAELGEYDVSYDGEHGSHTLRDGLVVVPEEGVGKID